MMDIYFQTCFNGLNIDVLTAVFLSVHVFWIWHCVIGWVVSDPWRWGQYIVLKHQEPVMQWRSFTSQKVVCIQAWCSHGAESAAFPLENKCYWYCVLPHSDRGRALYRLFWNYQSLVVIWFYS